ncbi:hypothetical protein PITCH_A890003 [uncultured Desulfobacterium sp.]|uniref:Ribbon-helix-helix protein CopG domain-containing protein n=1 Tax=uncultured Desulfobacterium sp. TaxID=201089 RepID=A0A445N3M6_9BACT|nr:hypothetical protein PITCH_A890003 [uncultured Desulfobacterium sp.]
MSVDKTKVSFWVPNDVLARIDKLAEMADIERSRLIINMLDEMSKSLMAVKSVGFLQIALIIRDAGEKLSDWVKDLNARVEIKGIKKD